MWELLGNFLFGQRVINQQEAGTPDCVMALRWCPRSEEVFQRRRYVQRPWKEEWRPARGGEVT